MYANYLKPFVDKLLAALVLVVFGWLLVVVALVVWVDLGRPILFVQKRAGKHGKVFLLYKFRTMKPENQEITPVYSFLRRTALDELPQLFNVLKGDMSWVGPRPLLPEYTAHYSAAQAKRLTVAQGLTGLAQIKGFGKQLSWQEKLEYDAQYVQKQSFTTDLKILFNTFWLFLSRRRTEANDLTRFDADK